jgi:hypothetical protein
MLLTGCADKLILFPSREPIRDTAARRLQVAGPVGGLDIWTMPSLGAANHEPTAFVLAFIGNASRAEWDAEQVAEQWGDRPVEVWAVNYPGYGQSEGSAKLASIAPAALSAYDAIKAHAGNRPVFVAGRSIGTTAALYVAAHRPVAGVILHSPPPLRSLIIGQFGWWNLWLAAIPVSLGVPADLDSIANARRVNAPAIFIITGADRLVPPSYQQQIVDAYAGPKQKLLMPGVDHNDPIPTGEMGSLRVLLDDLFGFGHGR